jgi:thiol-disulfide isomerase/thioredoxin
MADEKTEIPRTGETVHPDSTGDILPEFLIDINDSTWEKVVEWEKKPVAVMFYTLTCAFCHQMEPYLRNYAAEYRHSVIFLRSIPLLTRGL